MKKNRTPIVITRKDKRLHKGGHLAAFLLTGGMSAPVSAAKAASNAAYNARTRQLAAQAEAAEKEAEPADDSPLNHGYTLIPAAAGPVPDDGRHCPRCGRGGPFMRKPGQPHYGMGRRWCPGQADEAAREAETPPAAPVRPVRPVRPGVDDIDTLIRVQTADLDPRVRQDPVYLYLKRRQLEHDGLQPEDVGSQEGQQWFYGQIALRDQLDQREREVLAGEAGDSAIT
jgi:hypothetical protein